MADPAHVATDEKIKEIEKRLKKEYTRAAKETEENLNEYWAAFKRKDEAKKQDVLDGKLKPEEYQRWRTGQLAMGERWEKLKAETAENLANANKIARSIANGYMPEVYALNHNYSTYQIEHDGLLDTDYTLYDKKTVERLIRDNPELLPPPGKRVNTAIANGELLKWEEGQIQSVAVQSILQGESIPQMAKRIAETVSTRNFADAVRYARTASTSAQNAGRYDGYRRAKKLGVDLTIEWQATLDNRTRHDHRMLHGQRKEVDEPFEVSGYKILYPAQAGAGASDIPQSTIWNCRCTLLAWVKGFEGDTVTSSPKTGDLSFEEWQQARTMTKEEQDEWIKAGKPSLKEWLEPKTTKNSQKATVQQTAQKPVVPQFIPATTIKEAEAYAQSILADHVAYSGMSVARANEINRALHDLTQQYPVQRIREINTNPPRNGAASGSYSSLRFNPKKLGKTLSNDEENFLRMKAETEDMIRTYEERFAGKKIPSAIQERIDALKKKIPFQRWGVQSSYDDHVYVLVAHEYGHLLSDQYFGMLNFGRANPHYDTDVRLQQMRVKWRDAYLQARKSGDIYSLSQYGSANEKEFFAECFAAKVMGEKLPNYVEKLLSEVLTGGVM